MPNVMVHHLQDGISLKLVVSGGDVEGNTATWVGGGMFLEYVQADVSAVQVAQREIDNLLPNNRRQRRTCYALCHILYPVSAAHTSIFRMDSNSTSRLPTPNSASKIMGSP